MDRAPEYQAHQGLTLYFLGKLHSGLKKLSAYYRQRGVTVFNIASPAELGRAWALKVPHALVVDLQTREEITAYFEAMGAYEGLLDLPRVAIVSTNADEETVETLRTQCDAHVRWPLKATDLSYCLFRLLLARDHFIQATPGDGDDEDTVYRGALGPTTLRNLVQLIYLGRQDCILGLECEGRRGNLFFKEGRLIDAQVGALEWQDSLVLARRFKSGSFTLSFQPVDRKQFVDRSVTAWLLQEPEPGPEPEPPEPDEVTAVGARPWKDGERPAEAEEGGEGLAPPPAVPSPGEERPQEEVGTWSPDPLMPPPPPGPGDRERPAAGMGEMAALEVPALGQPGGHRVTAGQDASPLEPGFEPEERRSRAVLWLALLFVVAVGGIFVAKSLWPPGPVQVVQVPATIPPAPSMPRAVSPSPASSPAAKAPTPIREHRVTPQPAVSPSPEVHVLEPTPVRPPVAPPPVATPKTVKVAKVVVPVVIKATPIPVEPTPVVKEGGTPTPAVVAPVSPSPEPVEVAKVETAVQPITMDSVSRVLPDRNLQKARELERAGKLQEALAVYTQVAELDPTSREASEAIDRLKGSAEVNPNAPAELHINAFPYGIVYVDGEKYGYTPVHLNKVVPRKYLIRVVNPDLGACSTEVVVKPGERKWVHLRLDDEKNCQR